MCRALEIKKEVKKLKIDPVAVTMDRALYNKALEVKSKHVEQFQLI